MRLAGGAAWRAGLVLALALSGLVAPRMAGAQSIIEEWASVKAPPAPPEVKPVTVTASDTALLVLDFSGAQDGSKGPCSHEVRPRCIASIPAEARLLSAARAHGLFIAYSLGKDGTAADIATALAPLPGDPVVRSGPDKFVGTELGKLLADHGIKTVIVTGTSAEGAVLNSTTDAALHGMNAIVPVDTMSSAGLYAEQYVAWHLTHAAGVSAKTILTRSDLIRF